MENGEFKHRLFSAGMMKPMMHQDHLNSPGSDEGSHPNLHQERRTPSTEPYPMWNQDGYPLRSFTPPYQRQHESSDSGQPDDRSLVVLKSLQPASQSKPLLNEIGPVGGPLSLVVFNCILLFSIEVTWPAPNRSHMKRGPMSA